MKARQKYSHLQYTKDTFRRPGQIRKAFEEVAEYLRQAEGIMVLPKPTSMQEIYTTKQRVSGGREEGRGGGWGRVEKRVVLVHITFKLGVMSAYWGDDLYHTCSYPHP